jgi:hypothetical protein
MPAFFGQRSQAPGGLAINTSGNNNPIVGRPSSPGLVPPLPISAFGGNSGVTMPQPVPQRPNLARMPTANQLSEMDALFDMVDKLEVPPK